MTHQAEATLQAAVSELTTVTAQLLLDHLDSRSRHGATRAPLIHEVLTPTNITTRCYAAAGTCFQFQRPGPSARRLEDAADAEDGVGRVGRDRELTLQAPRDRAGVDRACRDSKRVVDEDSCGEDWCFFDNT